MEGDLEVALTDVKSAGHYLCLMAEPMTITPQGAAELGRKMVTLAEAYEDLTLAYGMVLASLAAQEPQDLM